MSNGKPAETKWSNKRRAGLTMLTRENIENIPPLNGLRGPLNEVLLPYGVRSTEEAGPHLQTINTLGKEVVLPLGKLPGVRVLDGSHLAPAISFLHNSGQYPSSEPKPRLLCLAGISYGVLPERVEEIPAFHFVGREILHMEEPSLAGADEVHLSINRIIGGPVGNPTDPGFFEEYIGPIVLDIE